MNPPRRILIINPTKERVAKWSLEAIRREIATRITLPIT